jgi:hemolysin III
VTSSGSTPREAVEGVAHRVEERVGDLARALKPRLRGVLHEAAFAVSLITAPRWCAWPTPAGRARPPSSTPSAWRCCSAPRPAYHRGTWSPRSHEVMKRLDHSMIFILIAGTYTPFGLLLLEGTARWTVLGVVWGGALLGIVLRNVVRRPARWLFVGLYLALGWVAIAFLPQISEAGGMHVLVLLLVGGLFYSLGAVVYATRRPDPSPRWFGFHEVFHAFTLAAFVVHYVAVSFATYGATA